MSTTVLLLLVILLCGIGLAWILFPPQSTSPAPRRAVKKRKTPGTAKTQTKKAPPRERSADEVMMARAGMTEKEAIRKVVEAFVAENPASSAKILQNWLRER